MKTTIVSLALSLLLPLSIAAPTSNPLSTRQTNGVLFQGADDTSFIIDNVPQDNTIFNITNPLSITTISTTVSAVCQFHGIDGSSVFVVGFSGQNATVGPPQAQAWGACLAFSFPGQLCEGTDPSIECSPHLPPGA